MLAVGDGDSGSWGCTDDVLMTVGAMAMAMAMVVVDDDWYRR